MMNLAKGATLKQDSSWPGKRTLKKFHGAIGMRIPASCNYCVFKTNFPRPSFEFERESWTSVKYMNVYRVTGRDTGQEHKTRQENKNETRQREQK